MASVVTLVVSGRDFPEVPKKELIDSSGYFSALFKSQFADSGSTVHNFSKLEWSTEAFEILLHYMLTGEVFFQEQSAVLFREALEISGYLLVDGFKPKLSRILVTSWEHLETDYALFLAKELNYPEQLRESILGGFLDIAEKRDQVSHSEMFDFVIQLRDTHPPAMNFNRYLPHVEKFNKSILDWYLDHNENRHLLRNPHVNTEGRVQRLRCPTELYHRANLKKSLLSWFLVVAERNDQDISRNLVDWDFLIVITKVKNFWTFNIHVNKLESMLVVRWKIIKKILHVLGYAVTLPACSTKAEVLVRNLGLLNLNETFLQYVLPLFTLEASSTECLQKAFEAELMVSKQRVCSIRPRIRIAGAYLQPERQTCTIVSAEFNSQTWNWKSEKCESTSLNHTICVTSDEYAAFLTCCGVLLIPDVHVTTCNRTPVCERLRPLFSKVMDRYVCNHAEDNCIFILSTDLSSARTKLYKLDVFNMELSECISIPATCPRLGGKGETLYIVGKAWDVYEYKVSSNELSLVSSGVRRSYVFDNILVIDKKMYLFCERCYATIDLRKNDDKPNIKWYAGLVTLMWSFKVMATAASPEGIVMLVRLNTHNYNYGDDMGNYEDTMIALLDPGSGKVECLGTLPRLAETSHWECFSSYICVQVDERPGDD